ncbi:Serine carboxypeptidase-like 51 [Papilio machaon]|uniref:Serine carboxypeptidase-like 51 n=1 Tax=Papilio machaon TaxID=76193 RepID=A0A194RPH1_PAPMA|nr:Serine carboxypeptidase-like 51 [Papilio machaon]
MVHPREIYYRLIKILFIIALSGSTEGITVSPSLCPTNKIAPHRRLLTARYGTQRTFGAFYDLLVPDNFQSNRPNLQEEPLNDSEDCGEIVDYDENDVGSATTESGRRHSSDNRFFLGNFFSFLRPPPDGYPSVFQPGRPGRPTRPPYGSGGYFSGNYYHPPSPIRPSDYVKPVHEDAQETTAVYRPGVVGAPLGHVVGVTQVRPTNRPPETTSKLNSNIVENKMFVTFISLLMLCWAGHLQCEEHNPYLDTLKEFHWKSIQKYVEVRPGAFLFYWFYYADGTSVGADKKPLIIWIQGGPGLAASGIANFAEIGPIDMNMQPRNHTWVKGRNLLLIDHPVGTGFSYVTNKSLLVKTDRQMALDLTKVIKAFFKTHKQFRKTPTYLFGQSYGGKLCPRLGVYLHTAIEKKRLKMNLRGIGIGSGWVDPKESTLVQPNFLYNMGVIDITTYEKTTNLVKKMVNYIDKKDYVYTEKLNTLMFRILNMEAGMEINFNNVNQASPYPALDELARKVNEYIKPTLTLVNQSLQWNYISDEAFFTLNNAFFVPSTSFLEKLLNKTSLKIAIYNGNLDVVTPLAGASNWVHKLRWYGAEQFRNAERVRINDHRNGFYKKAHRLSFWSVFGSGHWVPEENPIAMEQILNYVMSEEL